MFLNYLSVIIKIIWIDYNKNLKIGYIYMSNIIESLNYLNMSSYNYKLFTVRDYKPVFSKLTPEQQEQVRQHAVLINLRFESRRIDRQLDQLLSEIACDLEDDFDKLLA
ncbi:hypothetical protein MegaChil _gp0877 [Megavirus chiliensis]|nr:hypothetical protein MegaChil _gp0877 [Megavirus chiliensis]